MIQGPPGPSGISWSPGCLRKHHSVDKEHVDISVFGEIIFWKRDWECDCEPEEECHCTIYRPGTVKELVDILREDYGEDLPDNVREALQNLKDGKDHEYW